MDTQYDEQGFPLSKTYLKLPENLDFFQVMDLGAALVVEDGRVVRKHAYGFGYSYEACELRDKMVAASKK